jgi:hypothetical protein
MQSEGGRMLPNSLRPGRLETRQLNLQLVNPALPIGAAAIGTDVDQPRNLAKSVTVE